MAQDNRFDPARLERIERRLQVLEDAEAIRNLKARYAALCDNQYDADGIASLFRRRGLGKPGAGPVRRARGNPKLLQGSVGYLLLRDPLQPERPHRSGRRYGFGQCSCACCSVRNAVRTMGDPPQAAQDSARARAISLEPKPRRPSIAPTRGSALLIIDNSLSRPLGSFR